MTWCRGTSYWKVRGNCARVGSEAEAVNRYICGRGKTMHTMCVYLWMEKTSLCLFQGRDGCGLYTMCREYSLAAPKQRNMHTCKKCVELPLVWSHP